VVTQRLELKKPPDNKLVSEKKPLAIFAVLRRVVIDGDKRAHRRILSLKSR